MIFDERKHAKDMIAEGGEGKIYKTPSGTLVKVFKKNVNKAEKKAKIDILATKRMPSTVVAPVDIVTTPSGTFSGYEMPMVHGDELRSLSSIKFVRINAITKKDIVGMLMQVKNTLKAIHAQGMYVGDLNDSNILFDASFNVHFIDVDSWAIPPHLCDVVMDAFRDPALSGANFNEKTDAFAFAILSYKALTRLHPYGGTMPFCNDLDIVARMNARISVFNPSVLKPVIVDSDDFMPKRMLLSFKKIFDGNDRTLLDSDLDAFHSRMTFCILHNDFYFGGYTSCPVCVAGAMEAPIQVVMPMINGIVHSRILFQVEGAVLIDENCYIDGGIVKFRNSAFSFPRERGVLYHVTDRGDTTFQVRKESISVHSVKSDSELPTRYNSPAMVKNDSIYFISPGLFLTRASLLKDGVAEEPIEQVAFNAFFNIIDPSTYLVFNSYDESKIASVSGHHVTLNLQGKLEETFILFDEVKKQWLLVVNDGKGMETMLLDKDRGILFSTRDIKYLSSPSHCDFNNGFLYMPSDRKMTRHEVVSGISREFNIPSMTTGTTIRKKGTKFIAFDTFSIKEIG